MKDLRKEENIKKPNLFWFNFKRFNWRKILKKICFVILIFFLIFYPVETATIIGIWIKNFIGTIWQTMRFW